MRASSAFCLYAGRSTRYAVVQMEMQVWVCRDRYTAACPLMNRPEKVLQDRIHLGCAVMKMFVTGK